MGTPQENMLCKTKVYGYYKGRNKLWLRYLEVIIQQEFGGYNHCRSGDIMVDQRVI